MGHLRPAGLSVLIALGVLVPAAAHAQVERPPRWQLSAGGGVADFADGASSHLTTMGGEWDVRVMMGTSSIVAGELAYVGTANGLNQVMSRFAPGGVILGSALEADVRLQLPEPLGGRLPLRPFGFFGAGVNSFDLIKEDSRDPNAIANNDATFVAPFGGGLEVALPASLSLESRFTYRAMFDDELLHTNADGVPRTGNHGMSQWTLSARLGYVFY